MGRPMGRMTDPELDALLYAAIKHGMTEEELLAQRRSYVAAEAAWGSDADEADYETRWREATRLKSLALMRRPRSGAGKR